MSEKTIAEMAMSLRDGESVTIRPGSGGSTIITARIDPQFGREGFMYSTCFSPPFDDRRIEGEITEALEGVRGEERRSRE